MFLRLPATLRPHRGPVAIAYIGVLAVTALNLYEPQQIRRVIDDDLSRGNSNMLASTGMPILGVALLRGMFGFGRMYFTEWIANRTGYEVRQGRITIDGHDIRPVSRESLRQQMGVVRQATFLCSGSTADNICYGRLDAGDAEVEQAARTRNCWGDRAHVTRSAR